MDSVSSRGTPAWAVAVANGLAAAGCGPVIYVPDNPLSHILCALGTLHPDIRTILAMREEEAVGIAAGVYLGGGRPAVMTQSSGVGNALNAIGSLLVPYQIPVVMVVSMRGGPGEWNAAQVPMGNALPRVLDAVGVEHVTARAGDDVEEMVRQAAHLAFDTRTPVACLLPRRVTTA